MSCADLNDVSPVDAQEYRDAVIVRESDRLAQLSGWVRDTQGPWDDLDASVDSLVPLWQWYVDFLEADCPGVPRGLVGQDWVDDEVPRPARGYCTYTAEAIGHYLMLVCRRMDPSATWQVHETIPQDILFQNTGILLSNGVCVIPDVFVVSMMRRVLTPSDKQYSDSRRPEALRDVFVRWAGEGVIPARQEKLGPALPPPQPVPVPQPVLWRPSPPGEGPTVGQKPGAGTKPKRIRKTPYDDLPGATGEVYIFRGPESGVDHIERLDPLPAQPVMSALTRWGFESACTNTGCPEAICSLAKSARTSKTPRPIPDGVHEWTFLEDTLVIEGTVECHDDTVRLVGMVFSGQYSTPSYPKIVTGLVKLAARLEARIDNADNLDLD